jgi:hypothetical protein
VQKQREAPIQEQSRIALMSGESLGLIDHLVVPVETQPGETLEDGARTLVRAAGFVGILDAQQELSAVLSRVQPVEQRRARAAHVQIARG